MSYCRWSCMDFGCDLYCYEDVSAGYTTHVAALRVVGDVPRAEHLFFEGKIEEFIEAHKIQMTFLATCDREPIGLVYDGMSFNDTTLEAFRERLLELRRVGYRFPDHVLAQIDQEIAERDKKNDRHAC